MLEIVKIRECRHGVLRIVERVDMLTAWASNPRMPTLATLEGDFAPRFLNVATERFASSSHNESPDGAVRWPLRHRTAIRPAKT
jgi:hypothetical protein